MVGGPAQVQSHEEKNPAISLPQKIGSQISIFLLVRLLPACLAGWRRFSFFLRFAPLAKNRAEHPSESGPTANVPKRIVEKIMMLLHPLSG